MTTSELIIFLFCCDVYICFKISTYFHGGGGKGNPYNGLHMEAPPEFERGTFFGLQVYESMGLSQVEVYERLNLSFRSLK